MTKRKSSEINPQNHRREEKGLTDTLLSMLEVARDGLIAEINGILKGWRTEKEKKQGLEFTVEHFALAIKTVFNAVNNNNSKQYLAIIKGLELHSSNPIYNRAREALEEVSHYCNGPLCRSKGRGKYYSIYADCRELLGRESCSDDKLELEITSHLRNKVNDFLQEKAPDIFNSISNSGENKTLPFTSVKKAKTEEGQDSSSHIQRLDPEDRKTSRG